jgi:hypothetical protein
MENFKKFVYKLLKSGKMKDKYINLLLDNDSNLKLYQDALYSENDYEPYYILGKVTLQKFLLWHFLSNLNDEKIYDIDFIIEKNIKKFGSEFANFFMEKNNKKIQNQLFCFIAITEYLLDSNTVVGVGYGIVYNILSNIINDIHDLILDYIVNDIVIINNDTYSDEYGKIVNVYKNGNEISYKVLLLTGPSKMKTYIEKDTFNLKLSPIDIPYEDTRPLLERELERRDIIANINDKDEKYRRKLIEILIGMGKRPYETIWEELLINDPKLVEEIKKSVDDNTDIITNIQKDTSKNTFNINAKEFKPFKNVIKTYDKGFNDIILKYFNDFWYEYTDEEKENLKNYIIDIITEYNDTKNIEIAYEQLADLLLYWVGNIDFLIETCYSDESCKKYFDSLIVD